MDAFFESRTRRRGWNYESLKNLGQMTPSVQSHLKLVYLTLCAALAASAGGAYLHIIWNIGGVLTLLGCLGSTVWLLASPQHEKKKRMGLLLASSALQGATIGPLIQVAVDFDMRLVITAFVGTALAFACFSGAALVAKRREYLYLGGLLSSGLSILFWLRFASSIFGGTVAMLNAEIYFGLLLFLGYIVVDTQMIVERAHMGDDDYVKHSLELFTDFIAVFVRILIILLKNASDKQEKEKKKRRS